MEGVNGTAVLKLVSAPLLRRCCPSHGGAVALRPPGPDRPFQVRTLSADRSTSSLFSIRAPIWLAETSAHCASPAAPGEPIPSGIDGTCVYYSGCIISQGRERHARRLVAAVAAAVLRVPRNIPLALAAPPPWGPSQSLTQSLAVLRGPLAFGKRPFNALLTNRRNSPESFEGFEERLLLIG